MYRDEYIDRALVEMELRAAYSAPRMEYYVDCDDMTLVVRATVDEYHALVWRDYSAAQDVDIWIRDELTFAPLGRCAMAMRPGYRAVAELVMQADWSQAETEAIDDELLIPVRER